MTPLIPGSIKRYVHEGSWIIIGQIAMVFGSLAMVRILSEYLDPVQYGQLAIALTGVTLVDKLIMGSISAGIGRFYSIAAEKQDFKGYLQASCNLLILSTFTIILIALVLVGILYIRGYHQWVGLIIGAFTFSIFNGYNNTLSGIQNAARQRVIVAFHGGIDAWLRIVLSVFFINQLGANCLSVFVGYICSSLLITASQLIFLRRSIPENNDQTFSANHWMRHIWLYSFPLSSWGVFTWLQQASDRWALQIFSTTEKVGIYAIIYQLGYSPITIVTNMAVNFLGPILYQRSGDAKDDDRNSSVHRLAWHITLLSVFITFICFGFTMLCHEMIFKVFVAKSYRTFSIYLPWMILAGGFFAAAQVLALKLLSSMRTQSMIPAKILTAFVGIALNNVGASKYGIKGIIASLVIFSLIHFFWIVYIVQREHKKEI